MAIIAKKDKIGVGVQYLLTGNQDLTINKGVVVQSTEDNAVRAATGRHDITVAGTIIAYIHAIELGADVSGQRIIIQTTGSLLSDIGPAIYIGGRNTTIVNNGSIYSGKGIILGGVGGSTTILNSGVISGADSISVLNNQKLVLRNSGVISTPNSEAVEAGSANDLIVNRGRIIGTIDLGDGNDRYDGKGGFHSGSIFAQGGNDTFIVGRGAEVINGGDDTDLLDFRKSGPVKVALDQSFAGTGMAKGDSYSAIENLFGSLRGADRLRGDINNNQINGFGGRDKIEALAGQDTLVGGAGKDTLNGGGVGDDFFRFTKPGEGGDIIQDFSSDDGLGDNDTIEVAASGFKGGLSAGALGIGQFKSGGNNQAGDGNDRFIFRTGDTTLWFDRDGNGNAFAPVLIADLQAGATMTNLDILIF